VAGATASRRALVAICAASVALGLANVLRYQPGAGYDATDHMAYADGLVPGGHFPHGTGEYYTPPGFYALAGAADWVARRLGVSFYAGYRAGMALNVLFLLATVVLVWKLAQELWPGRDRLALAAAAFVAFLPASVKAEAMFHPEMLSLAACTLALWLCARTFRDHRYAPALGVALGLAQLTRAFALWTVFVVLVALAAGRRWRELAVALVLAAAVPAPWYVHQAVEYRGNPVFPRPATQLAHTASGTVKPLWARRPARFYLDPGLPAVVSTPYQEHFANLAWPTAYAELWGDYFGVWVWNWTKASPLPPAPVRAELAAQSAAGILPTLLAVAGWAAVLAAAVRRPFHRGTTVEGARRGARLAVALLPLVGILGWLYFAVSYPTPVGDVLKGSYMLSTAAGWALGFGYALERLRGRLATAALAALSAGLLLQVPFLLGLRW
jgi:hypothetical protein